MKKLISLAVRRPVSTLMCFSALVIFGFIAAADSRIEFLPEIQVPKLVVTAAYPGLPPEQIKELLAIPLEDGLSSINGVKSLFSVSREGLCTLELEFHWGTDMTMAAVETREAIDLVYPALPSDAKKPLVLPINPGEEPVVWIGIFPKSGDLALARRLADKEIKTRFQQTAGVGSVVVLGGAKEELQIEVDLEETLARGITLDFIARTIAQNNNDFPAGSFKEGGTQYLVKTDGRLEGEEEIRSLVVGRTEQGNRISLGELAAVSRGHHEKTSFFQLDGEEGVALLIRRKGGESPLSVSRNVRAELENVLRSYGKDLEIAIIRDTSAVIASSVANLVVAAVAGAVIAFFVLLSFTGKLKISTILILSMPVSILIALFLMRLTGISLNTMSLGGLAMGIGMLVDNSVVVLENLERRIPEAEKRNAENIITFTGEMAGSSFGSTVTSLVVFLPVIFLPGIIGALFRDLSLAVCFSLCASFLVSVTLVPVLVLLLKPKKRMEHKKKSRRGKRKDAMRVLEKCYAKALAFSLRRPLIVVLGVAALCFAGIVLFFTLEIEFMHSVDTGEINVTAVFPPGSSIDFLSRTGRQLCARALEASGAESVFLRAGAEHDDPYFLADPFMTPEKMQLTVRLGQNGPSALQTMGELGKLFRLEGADVFISLPDDIIAPLLGIGGRQTVLLASGADQEEALRKAESLAGRLETGGIFMTINIIPRKDKPGIVLKPRREMFVQKGVNLLAVSGMVRGCLDGMYPSAMRTDGREVDIRLRLNAQDRNDLEKIARMPLLTEQGGRVRLSDLLSLENRPDFSTLIRKNKRDVACLELSCAAERDGEARRTLAKNADKNAGYESLQETALEQHMTQIILVFALALLLLYLVLGAQFESFTLPVILMLALPLAFSGIVIALVVFGKSVNVSSCLGVLVLLGVSVNNSIILFENYKAKLKKGCPAATAVFSGSIDRLKAILITVLTTVTALIPMAIDPANKSSQSPMSAAIVGGLVVSTLLTLFVIPLVFFAYFRRKP